MQSNFIPYFLLGFEATHLNSCTLIWILSCFSFQMQNKIYVADWKTSKEYRGVPRFFDKIMICQSNSADHCFLQQPWVWPEENITRGDVDAKTLVFPRHLCCISACLHAPADARIPHHCLSPVRESFNLISVSFIRPFVWFAEDEITGAQD